VNEHDGRHHFDTGHRRRALEPEVDTGTLDAEGLPGDRPTRVLRRMLSGVLSYGVLIAVVYFLITKLAKTNWQQVASQISVWQILIVLALGLANIITNLPPQVLTLPGLKMRESFVTNTASSALSNTVPEGGAVATGLNFAMLRSWGFDLPSITSSYLTTGIWTNLVRYGLAAAALVIMVLRGEGGVSLLWLAIALVVGVAVAIGVLTAVLASDGFARRLGGLLGRIINPVFGVFHRSPVTDMPGEVSGFRTKLVGLVRTQWHALTIAMVVSQLTTCLVLGVAVRLQGLGDDEVSWARIIFAVSAMATVSLIAPTPGGIGVAEATLLWVLGAGLTDDLNSSLLIAIGMFRLATWFEPVPVGAASYLFWRKNRSWRRPLAAPAAASPAPTA
jgi:uncharacterized membrane protein YbhN (UPF0104 family)